MTKKELVEALSAYNDDQYVGIILYRDDMPYRRGQIFIQGITPYLPWHPENPTPDQHIIGLVVHDHNRILDSDELDLINGVSPWKELLNV